MLHRAVYGFQVDLFWFFHVQDTGISVRKRVIKILRDICLEQPTFSKITEMCVKMIRRVNDEEGIKVWIIYFSVFSIILCIHCDFLDTFNYCNMYLTHPRVENNYFYIF